MVLGSKGTCTFMNMIIRMWRLRMDPMSEIPNLEVPVSMDGFFWVGSMWEFPGGEVIFSQCLRCWKNLHFGSNARSNWRTLQAKLDRWKSGAPNSQGFGIPVFSRGCRGLAELVQVLLTQKIFNLTVWFSWTEPWCFFLAKLDRHKTWGPGNPNIVD